jgi:hypothetical protein
MELLRDRIGKARHRSLLRDSCLLTGMAIIGKLSFHELGRLCTDWVVLATDTMSLQPCCRVEPLARQGGSARQQGLPVVSLM